MSNLPTTDSTAATANKTVVQVLNDCIPIAETAIIAAWPPAATPVFKQCWEEVFQLIVQEFTAALGIEGAYITMDIQDFLKIQTALSSLAALTAAHKTGDSNAITQANTDADSALAPIIHYVGDARTQ